jgi:hypothetical protein
MVMYVKILYLSFIFFILTKINILIQSNDIRYTSYLTFIILRVYFELCLKNMAFKLKNAFNFFLSNKFFFFFSYELLGC